MRNSILAILLLAAVAACSSTTRQGNYGSYVAGTSAANEMKVVEDVVKRLVTAYPPARTRLNLQHSTSDSFGTALVTTMRTKGYALAEHKGDRSAPAGAAGNTFAYVFDQPAGTDLYRVTLLINSEALSRVYETKNGTITPAGSWVRKE